MENETKNNTENAEDSDLGQDWISRLCYEHGYFCATHPKLVIIFTIVVVFSCSAPLFSAPLFGGSAAIEWITLSSSGVSVADSRAKTQRILQGNDSTIPRWFVGDPLLYIQQFILMAHISPWRPRLQNNMVIKEALRPAFNITKFIMFYRWYFQFFFLIHLFERFNEDPSVLDDLYLDHSKILFNTALREYILGLPIKYTGIYPSVHGDRPNHVIQYAITLVLSSHDSRYVNELCKQLKKKFPLASQTAEDNSAERDNVVHIYYKGEHRELIELLPLCVTYFIVFLYLAFAVGKIEMVKSKWGLALSAVLSVVASLVMASGLCSFFGLVTTLDSCEIFPYLIIILGVENILVITKSVVSTPVDLEVKIRVAQGLSKEGWYILKNFWTEIAICSLFYLTYVPAIQEFCLFASICLFSDFYLQMVLFVTVLSIDIRRMELSDLQRLQQTASQRRVGDVSSTASRSKMGQGPSSPLPTPPHSPEAVQFFGLLPPLPPSSLVTQSSPPRGCPVIPKKLPKRLNVAYFWARNRIVQKACMVCFIIYFLSILSYPSTDPLPESPEGKSSLDKLHNNNFGVDNEPQRNQMNQPKEKMTLSDEEMKKKESLWKITPELSSKAPPSVEMWKGLYQRHWPELLNYYNISLLGRYLSVLPPVHLGISIDTDIFVADSFQDVVGFSSANGTLKLEQPLGAEEEAEATEHEIRDPEYFHNALTCVVLGVVVMIILFFVCKFLNDLQVSPRSGRSRKGTGCGHQRLVESVPVTLRGHSQNVEHLICRMPFIISVCLGGQICVWDIPTGYRLRVINRESHGQSEVAIREGKSRVEKSKYKSSVERGSGLTAKRNTSEVPFPRPILASEDTSHTHCSENVSKASNEVQHPVETEDGNEVTSDECVSKESNDTAKSAGYDFSKYANGEDIPRWSPSSRGSFSSSWTNPDEDGPEWLTSSEESGDEEAFVQTSSYHGSQLTTGASVWCVDCWGDFLVVGCSDGTIEIWSVLSGAQLYVSRDNTVGVCKLRFYSSRFKYVNFSNTSVGIKGTRANISMDSSQCRINHKLRAHHQPISVLDVMDGRVITGSHDRTLKVFRTDECVCVYTLHGHADSISALTVDKTNNRQVVSGAANGGVRVWDVISGECLQHLRGHVKSVTAVACTAEHLLSVSLESVLCIWDRSRGECLHRLKQVPDLCSNVAMLSRALFITGGQGHISVWDVRTGRRVKTVLLGDDDTSVFVRYVKVCDNKTVVCNFGKEVKIVTFPAVMDKAE
ncbi:PREDICTED: sterol regulatory element-binding protein cleavage-activating protein-like [Acropora digitifera]|uniref:sterol regulatory element-binding protein cleavage-activating protein-like n=1 Tax=Acropora digitifera TaxID=70779 RepID=UPI00077A4A74|nr:PREDICTED: sterol regulatory element-binding protein cleavage-activating protein-like [Acropora digitifera]